MVDVEYYHVPLRLPERSKPLTDCTVSISTYVGKERCFLENLATSLGAGQVVVLSRCLLTSATVV